MSAMKRSIVWQMLLPVPVICSVAIIAAAFLVPRLVAADAVENAVEEARRTVGQLETVRAYYTRQVVAKVQSASISVYSRNIILWTAAKINIDPENAYQPSTSVQGSGSQFKQGVERYNVNPWVIPVGVKLNVIF